MVNKQIAGWVAACCVAASLVGCGKKDAPADKTAEQAKSERDASAAKARESAVFGSQLQSMDKAKATADEAAKVAADRAKKADQ
ncbi:MAG: hypothetical protein H7232_09585 [Aeromicrobium sp.]|nr:hypothetical protein [Burkholderiales bacterium]